MTKSGSRSTYVQGTVSGFDSESRTGAVLLDDGTELSFEAAAFAGSGLRLLRAGQRVRLETLQDEGDDNITVLQVQILTIPRT